MENMWEGNFQKLRENERRVAASFLPNHSFRVSRSIKDLWSVDSNEIITLFIDNLSPQARFKPLLEYFGRVARIYDMFISKKKRPRRSDSFGFIRVVGADARRLIIRCDGDYVLGRRISLTKARFSSGNRKKKRS